MVLYLNLLFVTLLNISSIDSHNIYTDLMREFANKGNNVYIVSPVERRLCKKTHLIETDIDDFHKHIHILKLKTGNIQKTNIIEKGISTVMLEKQLVKGIKKYFSHIKFDIMIYSTPPITLVKPIKYIKSRDNARTYLLLKDIFPQNAVDLGMMKTTGLLSFIYKYFRKKEKKLYELSDRIGCMSNANVDYLLANNPQIASDKVEICPNSIEIMDFSISEQERVAIRKKYDIPLGKTVYIYGGNLGRPQGIPYIIDCIKSQKDNERAFFLIVGDGTEYVKIEQFVNDRKQDNVRLMKQIPKEDYDHMVSACDVGMIFLDYRFTIPNFPSRLLSYMQSSLPIIACTDGNTDIGKVIVDGNFGWWCSSNDIAQFANIIEEIENSNLKQLGSNGRKYLEDNYDVKLCAEIVIPSNKKE